jgi:hypothetical protein
METYLKQVEKTDLNVDQIKDAEDGFNMNLRL